MKVSKFIFVFSMIIGFASFANSQENWLKIENDSKDFSISVPSNYQVLSDKKGFYLTTPEGVKKRNFNDITINDIRYVTAFRNDASFLIARYKTNKLKEGLEILSSFYQNNVDQIATASVNNFIVKSIESSSDKSYTFQIFIGSQNEIYHISGAAKDNTNEYLKYFFLSIKLNNKKIFSTLSSSLEGKISEQNIQFSALTDTPFSVTKANKEESDVQKTLPQDDSQNKKTKTPLQILFKPRPTYSDEARQNRTQGTVLLKVTFSAEGNIDKIVIVKGLSDGLTDSAIRSARLIRFLPLKVDNIPTSTVKTVEYTFSIY